MGAKMSLRCILSKFYIKPQLDLPQFPPFWRCILSKFYIKPQLRWQRPDFCCVVSYRNSTSNHNVDAVSMSGVSVVSYRNSTSNHNTFVVIRSPFRLYLIEILHQTTTLKMASSKRYSCILSKFYIKPQLAIASRLQEYSCILSKFYIKPQLSRSKASHHRVVSYRNSTSNHNIR